VLLQAAAACCPLIDRRGEYRMYKHILIPTDGSERSEKAIAHGAALAAATGAKVTVLTVTAPLHSIASDPTPVADIPGSADFVREYLHGQARDFLAAAECIVAARGIACETLQITQERPYAAILETAEANRCDLIVMASHGRRGISAILLGSETMKVLTHGTVPVLVHRS
jgi:nucleotide-binding universal stress UspA family protein